MKQWLGFWPEKISLTLGSAGLILHYVLLTHTQLLKASINKLPIRHKPLWALPLAHPVGDNSCLTWLLESLTVTCSRDRGESFVGTKILLRSRAILLGCNDPG